LHGGCGRFVLDRAIDGTSTVCHEHASERGGVVLYER
jgi:hypothetical protein